MLRGWLILGALVGLIGGVSGALLGLGAVQTVGLSLLLLGCTFVGFVVVALWQGAVGLKGDDQ